MAREESTTNARAEYVYSEILDASGNRIINRRIHTEGEKKSARGHISLQSQKYKDRNDLLVYVDGPQGSGKNIYLKNIRKLLKSQGYDIEILRETSGDFDSYTKRSASARKAYVQEEFVGESSAIHLLGQHGQIRQHVWDRILLPKLMLKKKKLITYVSFC